VRLFHAVGTSGVNDPYVRQTVLTLLYPVLISIVVTEILTIFQRRIRAKDA
jgi:hypothetical protein